MTLVLDASVALAWTLDDEDSDVATAAFDEVGSGVEVPAHWPLEVANGLRMAERRGRLLSVRSAEALARIFTLGIAVDDGPWPVRTARALDLSRRYALTVYDAAYLELAERRNARLATLDRDLLAVLALPEFAAIRFEP